MSPNDDSMPPQVLKYKLYFKSWLLERTHVQAESEGIKPIDKIAWHKQRQSSPDLITIYYWYLTL